MRSALLVSTLFLAGCELTVLTHVDRSEGVAAVAIRDNVSDFEKWGTKTFTRELLKAGYERHWYFAEDRPGGSRAQAIAALRHALVAYQAVNLFLLAHSNRYVDWVREIDPALRTRLRLVYNTGCGDASQAEEWMALGARAYVAHGGSDNIAPIFYYHFLPEWAAGRPLAEAVARANETTKSDLFAGPAGWVISALPGDRDAGFYWKNTEAHLFGSDGFSLSSTR